MPYILLNQGQVCSCLSASNGAGKTTTVGKLAHQLKEQGKRVLLVAADTFRAGAIQQLQEWGRRVDVPVVDFYTEKAAIRPRWF